MTVTTHTYSLNTGRLETESEMEHVSGHLPPEPMGALESGTRGGT